MFLTVGEAISHFLIILVQYLRSDDRSVFEQCLISRR